MVRKTLETPPVDMDDALKSRRRDELAAEYPQVGWRESELPFLFLGHGVADGDDLNIIQGMGLDHREIRKRTDRIKHIH